MLLFNGDRVSLLAVKHSVVEGDAKCMTVWVPLTPGELHSAMASLGLPGGADKTPPANAGSKEFNPWSRRLHTLGSHKARVPQLLSRALEHEVTRI